MKKIVTLLSSLLLSIFVFTSANAAGDEEAIKKRSSYKKTGIDIVADVIDKTKKNRKNIEKNRLQNIKHKE